MSDRYFPIKTDTACQLKWSWTTLYLNSGFSRSCHRTSAYPLTPENFDNFHNNPVVLDDRRQMLQGQWPENNCGYCQEIESVGGTSDRIVQLSIPNLFPPELTKNLTQIEVSPTMVEVYFNNSCNLGCLYCDPILSSTINAENQQHGIFNQSGITLQPIDGNFKDLVPYFWKWFDHGFSKLKRLQVLGGEPLYQKEFDKLLDKIEENGNSECVLSIVTNLMVPQSRLEFYIERFKKILASRKLKRIDITCSIDCWGPQQEYVRWGLNLVSWEQNFNLLLKQKWLILNINQTISSLTIKTMPELLSKLNTWREQRKIGHWFSGITPGPSYMKAGIFNNTEFQKEFDIILSLMPETTEENKTAKSYMTGIMTQINHSSFDTTEIKKLIIYLDEKDRRRGTNWETVFPWLKEYKKYVVQ
jgi:hypothetical protein